jgi:flagellar motor switch protein FliM
MVGVIETALGAKTNAEIKARALTPVEERVFVNVLRRVVTLLAGSLGVEAKDFRIARSAKELVDVDDSKRGDPLRLGFQLAINGVSGTSTLRVYLAGVKTPAIAARAASTKDPKKPFLPPHVGEIEVDVCAQLATVEVPLQDLLSLEVGDVVLLGAKVGDPIVITAEGERCARADLGRHEGRLALRIRSVESRRDRNT